MDDAALDKLISEIQDFLRNSEQHELTAPPQEGRAKKGDVARLGLTTRAMASSSRIARLLEVCAYAWAVCLTGVLIGVLAMFRPTDASGVAQVFLLFAFGVFTTLALLGASHRVGTLLRIERNTREILRLRRRQNSLLSRLIDRG